MKKANQVKLAEQEQLNELKNQLARALADYDNLTRRVDREREDLGKVVATRFVIRLLPIVDMLESAQVHLGDPGLAISLQQLKDVLKQEGFEEISLKPEDDFDETKAEVVDVVEADEERSGKIAEVLQTGWKMGEYVVRHAKVKVYKQKNITNE